MLSQSNIKEITRWKTIPKQFAVTAPLVVTDEALAKAEAANPCDIDDVDGHLYNRGIPDNIAAKYKMCSTSRLTTNLDSTTIENLGLILPQKFGIYVKSRNVHGISVPYYFSNKFCGFATRVLGENSDFAKYVFTCPNRFCFGTDLGKPEVFIVEGVFDAVALLERGMNTLGMGDSQPNYFKMWVASKFQKINLLLDGDYAGCLGSIKCYYILTKLFDMLPENINILSLPDGKDPANEQQWTQISFRNLLDKTTDLGIKLSTGPHED
jgi:DNA primase